MIPVRAGVARNTNIVAGRWVEPVLPSKSGEEQTSPWFGNLQTVGSGRLNPKCDRVLGVFNRFYSGFSVGHAAGQFRHVHDEGGVLLAPPDNCFVIVVFLHSSLYWARIL